MRLFLSAVLIGLLAAGPAPAGQTTVAVAANFVLPMRALVADYERDSGHQVTLVPGSSGKLYAQVRAGAPFDAFFSADQAKPLALLADGLAVTGSRFTYASGRLVLWSADPARRVEGPAALGGDDFRRLAIANPRLAPYGVAAMETLQALGAEASTRSRRVIGENIAQAYQFVSTGNAELGLVAASQVLRSGQIVTGSGWLVPASLHAPIRQDAVLLTRGADNPATLGLLAYMRSDAAVRLIGQFGYTASPSDGLAP